MTKLSDDRKNLSLKQAWQAVCLERRRNNAIRFLLFSSVLLDTAKHPIFEVTHHCSAAYFCDYYFIDQRETPLNLINRAVGSIRSGVTV